MPGPVQVALDQYRKSEADFLKSEDSSATEAVQDATRSLARSLQTYPEQAEAAVESVRTATADEDMVAVRVQSIDLFLEQLQDLRDVLFEKLLTTVDEVSLPIGAARASLLVPTVSPRLHVTAGTGTTRAFGEIGGEPKVLEERDR